MKNKITFKDLSTTGKNIEWNSKKNADDTHEVTVVFDYKKEIVLSSVPSQYVEEDGKIEKKSLNEEESIKLIDARMQSLLNSLQQAIFTIKFYGGSIDGFIASKTGKKDGKK